MCACCIHGRDPGKQQLPEMAQATTFTAISGER